MVSPTIKISAGKGICSNGLYSATKKITLISGDDFSGSGNIESPEIEISTKTFTFTGTIKCDGNCTIKSEFPFNHAIFTQKGKGLFTFKVEPLAIEPKEQSIAQKATPIDQKNENYYLEQACKYRDGKGVEKDPIKAVEYFALAAEKGCNLALVQMGLYYIDGTGVEKDPKKGIALLTRAAEKEYPSALYYLGLYYIKGIGVEKDEKKAFEFFLKGAQAGEIDAIIAVAQCYCYGIGTEQNTTLAETWNNNQKIQMLNLTQDQSKRRTKTMIDIMTSAILRH